MSLVTVQPTAQLRRNGDLELGLDLHEGDVMEATALGDGILLRPKDIVDRGAAAARVAVALDAIERTPEDARRSEEEIMADAIADIAEPRRARRAADG